MFSKDEKVLVFLKGLSMEGISSSSPEFKQTVRSFPTGHKLSLRSQPRQPYSLDWKILCSQVPVNCYFWRSYRGTIRKDLQSWVKHFKCSCSRNTLLRKSNITYLWIQAYENASSSIWLYFTWFFFFVVDTIVTLWEFWRTKCYSIIMWYCAQCFWAVA